MRDSELTAEAYDLLPSHMREGMRLWMERGICTGGFLSAVLRNDLMGAMEQADIENLHALPQYGRFLYNYAPHGSFGSRENFAAWRKRGGLSGDAP